MIGKKNITAAWQMFRSYAVLRPWQTATIIALFFLASLAESVGILGLLPLLAVFQGTANSAQASGPIGMMMHGLAVVGLAPGLGSALLVIVGAMVCSNGFIALAQAYIAYSTSRLVMEMRVNMIRSLGEARWGYFVEQPVGQIVNVLGPQVQTASTGIIRSLNMASLVVQTLALFAASLLVSWQVTLAGAFLALLIAATLDRFVSMSRVTGGELIRIQNAMMNTLIDGLQGIKPLKAMAREQALVRLLRSDARRMMRAFVRNQLASIILDRLPTILVLMLLGGFIYTAVTMTGAALPEVIVVAAFGYRAMGRISDLQKSLQKIVAIYGAYRLVRNTQDRLTDHREHTDGTRHPRFEREIRFEEASFSYGNGDVLAGVDLVVPASGLTVLIGPSGAGKSTIVDLVLGLRRATGGRILIDGVPIEEIDVRTWRSMIGYVPQEVRLFDRSLYENVALDEPSVTRADVELALRQAEASDFVDNLPAGIDSPVGQAGLSISGGQRQRIALARALVHQPRLLLLDEATSALDPESERRICATLKHIAADKAILAISHQPRILEIADRAYRIDGGEVRPLGVAVAG